MARWMRGRRSHRVVPEELARGFEGYRRTLRCVEEAKASLAAAAPSGRARGVPLAEAIAAFEEGLSSASEAMPQWRGAGVEEAWTACQAGLAEAGRRVEELRVEGAPEGYEALYGTLADIMDPLDEVFSSALRRFGELGVYRRVPNPFGRRR